MAKKVKTVDDLQQLIINNNDKEGFYGDGKDIPDIPEVPEIPEIPEMPNQKLFQHGWCECSFGLACV